MIPRIERDQFIAVMFVLAAFLVGQYVMGDRPMLQLSNQAGQVTSH